MSYMTGDVVSKKRDGTVACPRVRMALAGAIDAAPVVNGPRTPRVSVSSHSLNPFAFPAPCHLARRTAVVHRRPEAIGICRGWRRDCR